MKLQTRMESSKNNYLRVILLILSVMIVAFFFLKKEPVITVGAEFALIEDIATSTLVDVGTFYEKEFDSSLPNSGKTKAKVHKNRPAVTLEKWNGEVGLTVAYDAISANAVRVPNSNKIKYAQGGNPAIEMRTYPLTKSADLPEGGYEIELVLNKKPTGPNSNVFDFTIEGHENLDFFYQNPLSLEFENGNIPEADSCSETQCFIDGEDFLGRPENVAGSYAVYHKNNRDHKIGELNYGTGKAYHIYRPKIIDADGVAVWGELSYSNGVLSVTVPQSFLNSATYPVIVDPTFGYDTVGGSLSNVARLLSGTATSYRVGGVASSTEGGYLVGINFPLYTDTGNSETVDVTAFLNQKDDPSSNQHSEVAKFERLDVSVISATPTWYLWTMGGATFSADVDYVLNIVGDGSDVVNDGTDVETRLDSVSGYDRYFEIATGGSGYATRRDEDPWTDTSSGATLRYSAFATYCQTDTVCHIASSTDSTKNSTTSLTMVVPDTGFPASTTILVTAGYSDTAPIEGVTVTDSAGNTYTAVDESYLGDPDTFSHFYAYNINALNPGEGVVVTFDAGATGGAKVGIVDNFYGLASTSDPYDVYASSTGSGATADSGNTDTTSQADEMIYTIGLFENDDGGQPYTAGDTFTSLTTINTNGGAQASNLALITGFKQVSSTGTYNGTTTNAESIDWLGAVSTWKLPTAAAPPAAGESLEDVIWMIIP